MQKPINVFQKSKKRSTKDVATAQVQRGKFKKRGKRFQLEQIQIRGVRIRTKFLFQLP